MNVLLIGAGGREHALAWAISASPCLVSLHAAPGNPGIGECAQCHAIDVMDASAVIALCKTQNIDFVVVGPEAPLVAGLVDALEKAGIAAFGPTKAAAQLEGSKAFTKALCVEANIPTAAFGHFADQASALAYLATRTAPIVIKADGLAAGKGVTVAFTLAEAQAAVSACFAGQFGAAGAEVVIEEFLNGEEVSYFVLSDGEAILPLTSAQDHKRVGDGDVGPNTGGMGAYSPAPIFTAEIEAETLTKIIKPTIAAMAKRGTPYRGVLYAGLMLTVDGPKLIEYNCRFGDPETQTLVRRLKDDLLLLLCATSDKTLSTMSVRWYPEPAITVVLAAKGYPQSPERGGMIAGLEEASKIPGVDIFHAGTAFQDGKLIAHGGRVLNVTATGTSFRQARERAYRAVELIDFADGFCRHDIGRKAQARET